MRERKSVKQRNYQEQNNKCLGMKMCQLADGTVIAYDTYIKQLRKQK